MSFNTSEAEWFTQRPNMYNPFQIPYRTRVGSVQQQQLKEPNAPWTIKNLKFSGKYAKLPLDVVAHGDSHEFRGFQVSPDGTRLLILSRKGSEGVHRNGEVHSYKMTTPHDLTTLSYVGTVDINTVLSAANLTLGHGFEQHGLYIRPDTGKEMYILRRRYLLQFEMQTPWDVTSAVYVRHKFLDDNGIFTPKYNGVYATHDITLSPDGKTLVVDERVVRRIHQWFLATPWDISSIQDYFMLDVAGTVEGGSYDSFLSLRGSEFDPTGLRFYCGESSGSMRIREYHLTDKFDLRSAKYIRRAVVNPPTETYPEGVLEFVNMDWRSDGTGVYVVYTEDSNTDPKPLSIIAEFLT